MSVGDVFMPFMLVLMSLSVPVDAAYHSFVYTLLTNPLISSFFGYTVSLFTPRGS